MGDEVIQNLCRTSQFAPCVLVTTHAVQQVEDGVALAACLISGRRIDSQAAVHTQRGAVVPYLRYRSMRNLIHFVEIDALVTTDDEYIRHACHVSNHIDVGRVVNLQSVYQESVAVEFRFQRFGSSEFPHTVLVLFQICHTRTIKLTKRSLDFLRRQEVAGYLHLYGFRRLQAESYCIVVVYLR